MVIYMGNNRVAQGNGLSGPYTHEMKRRRSGKKTKHSYAYISNRKRKKLIPREEAIQLYWQKFWTLKAIGQKYGCSDSHISATFKAWDIPVRRFTPRPNTLTKELSPFELGWMTAALDGEGNISYNETWSSHTIMIANTIKAFCIMAETNTGIGSVRRSGKTRKYWIWRLSDRLTIEALLKQLLPYLTVKREKAEKTLKQIAEWKTDLFKENPLTKNNKQEAST